MNNLKVVAKATESSFCYLVYSFSMSVTEINLRPDLIVRALRHHDTSPISFPIDTKLFRAADLGLEQDGCLARRAAAQRLN
jgi:hypothetical protein